MGKDSKDFGVSLMQRNPSKDLLLEKMRGKLASTPSASVVKETRRLETRRKGIVSWGWRAAIAVAFISANVFFFKEKEVIISRIGLESVPALPKPDKRMSADEQALYWTY